MPSPTSLAPADAMESFPPAAFALAVPFGAAFGGTGAAFEAAFPTAAGELALCVLPERLPLPAATSKPILGSLPSADEALPPTAPDPPSTVKPDNLPTEAVRTFCEEHAWHEMAPPAVENEALPMDFLHVAQITHSTWNFPRAQFIMPPSMGLLQPVHLSPCCSE